MARPQIQMARIQIQCIYHLCIGIILIVATKAHHLRISPYGMQSWAGPDMQTKFLIKAVPSNVMYIVGFWTTILPLLSVVLAIIAVNYSNCGVLGWEGKVKQIIVVPWRKHVAV